jgi:hypothetical protein
LARIWFQRVKAIQSRIARAVRPARVATTAAIPINVRSPHPAARKAAHVLWRYPRSSRNRQNPAAHTITPNPSFLEDNRIDLSPSRRTSMGRVTVAYVRHLQWVNGDVEMHDLPAVAPFRPDRCDHIVRHDRFVVSDGGRELEVLNHIGGVV